jgi:hypothetical protein
MTDVMHPSCHRVAHSHGGAEGLNLANAQIKYVRETRILAAFGCCSSFHSRG